MTLKEVLDRLVLAQAELDRHTRLWTRSSIDVSFWRRKLHFMRQERREAAPPAQPAVEQLSLFGEPDESEAP